MYNVNNDTDKIIATVAAVSLMVTSCGLYNKYENKTETPTGLFGATAQESLLNSQLSEAANMYKGTQAVIALYIALGGGTK